MQTSNKANSLLGMSVCLHWQCAFFLNVDNMGRKTSYLRSPDRWDGGRLQTPAVPCCDRTDTQRKKTNLSPSKFVPVQKKRNGKSICPRGGWWTRWSRFSFWSQVKCSIVLLIMESWRRSCQMRLWYGETSCFIPTPLKWDTTERCWTRSPSYAPNQSTNTCRLWLLTAWSAQWFSPLVHFRVNFPPINVWFPGPYCVLLLPYHADEFSLSDSLRAKWKGAANVTPYKKRGKNPRRKSLNGCGDPV